MSAAYVLATPFSLTGNETVDVTTNGYKWYFPAGVPRVLNWSVSSSLWIHPILQSTETQADFARAFGNIQEFINVQFNFLGYIYGTNGLAGYENAYLTGSDLNITYAFNSKTSSGTTISDGKFTTNFETAFCYFPDLDYNSKYLGAAGDTFLNYNNSFLANATFENGTSSFALLLHEILHGLGLKHPHDSGGTGRPTYTQLGIKFADRQWISIMSYDLYENGGDGAYSGSQPIGPMLLDAIALQYLYGESSFNSGDTTYDLKQYLGDYYNCQWDASGTDLLDAGNLTYGVVVELGSGQLSNGLNLHHFGFITTALDYIALSLTNPSKWTWLWGEYENVNGSPYYDIISGNDLANVINGGNGDDYLSGGSGDDRFDWDVSLRGGDDTFAGGPGNDIYVLDSIRDVVKEESFEGVDTVFVGFNYSIANTAIENVKTFSNQTSALTFTGNSWTNVLEGGSGDDSLYGGEGSDTLKGGLGNDLIDGGLDTDYAVFSSAFSELSFKASGPDIIVTSKGEGTDTLRNMEFINAGGTVYNLSNILTSTLPTYKLTTVDSTVNEGSTATFTVSTTNVASGTSLAYALLGVSASDITGGSLTGTTTVGANGQATISIPLAADQTTEGDETLTVTVQGQSASTTIKDTSLTPTIQFSISSGSAAEGNSGNSTITVQAALSIASTKTVTVPVTYSGTATQGTDYTNATSSITIAAGQTTGSATFSILGDTNVEPNETVILTMGTPTIATLGTNKVYTHSIVNEDEIFFAPLLNSNNGHYYQLVQSNVDWFSALAGSASQSYRGLGGYLLVIDDLSESNFVKVLPGLSGPNYAYWLGINDADKEGFWVIKAGPDLGQNAKFFDWVAGEPNNYGSQENFAHIWGDDRQKWNDLDVTGSPFFSMGYIVEYGGLPVTYTITPLVASVIEGSSVTFTIDTKNVEWGTNISYTLTGISQSDLASGSLTGTTVVSQQGVDGRATVTVALAADSLLETPESLRLTVGSTTSAPVTVLDLPRVPLPTVQFTTTAGSANEGNTGSTTVTVQATLSAASTQTVTIPISYSGTASPGTDYTNAATSITIAAGQTTGSATFSVIGDTTFESNETVILTLGTPTNATLGANTSYTHTITNDDVALSTYAISAGATSYNEGTSASFTVTTTNVAANTSLNFTITGLNAADVTGGSLSGTTTVGANGQATISVPLAADQTTEGDETLTVTVQGQTASTRIVDLSRNYPLMLGDDANNSLVGGGAGDYIFGGKGNDTLEGGEGVDTAVMGGDLSRYRVSVTSQGVEVADKVTGEIDTLKNMERIEFGDKVLNLTIQRSQALVSTADANRIAELYVAFFNRVPEADGLEYWIKERAKGMSIEAISNNFYAVGASNDYAALTGFRADMGDQDFINLFYRNVLGRSEGADPGGLAYWQGKLSRGEVTRGKLAEQIISAAYEYRADPTLSGVVQLLENKVSVARKVAMEWGLNYNADGATAYAQSQQVAKAISADSTESALALIGVTSADLSLG